MPVSAPAAAPAAAITPVEATDATDATDATHAPEAPDATDAPAAATRATSPGPWRVPGLRSTGSGRADVRLDPSWRSWIGPHGGLLAALLLTTASELAPQGQVPRALTAQFLAPTAGERATAVAEVLRSGSSSSVVSTALRDAQGAVTTTAVLTSGRLRSSTTVWDAVPAPAAPAAEQCAPVQLPVELVPFGSQLDFHPVGAHPLSGGTTPELLCWVRLRDGGTYDAAALTVLVDVLPPALYGATTSPVPVPTVELSVVLTDAPPASGWVLTRSASRTAEGGWCVDDVEVWDTAGRLLAQSRQLRRVLGNLVLGDPLQGDPVQGDPVHGNPVHGDHVQGERGVGA